MSQFRWISQKNLESIQDDSIPSGPLEDGTKLFEFIQESVEQRKGINFGRKNHFPREPLTGPKKPRINPRSHSSRAWLSNPRYELSFRPKTSEDGEMLASGGKDKLKMACAITKHFLAPWHAFVPRGTACPVKRSTLRKSGRGRFPDLGTREDNDESYQCLKENRVVSIVPRKKSERDHRFGQEMWAY